jgi:hypothetical protein
VSDDGLVVGHVSKPISPVRRATGSNQAFVWDVRAGIRGIGMPEGDLTAFASGISRDGRRISGYSVGPNRKRACIWERDGERWKAAVLPESAQLRSTHVPISGDGRFIAAVAANSPCLWTRDASGRWTREVIGNVGSMVPRAVNDAGTVVGTRYTPDGLSLPHDPLKAGTDYRQHLKLLSRHARSLTGCAQQRLQSDGIRVKGFQLMVKWIVTVQAGIEPCASLHGDIKFQLVQAAATWIRPRRQHHRYRPHRRVKTVLAALLHAGHAEKELA